jgi:hypothetical protein
VFTARYALSPYIKQIGFVFKGLINKTRNLQSSHYKNVSTDPLRYAKHTLGTTDLEHHTGSVPNQCISTMHHKVLREMQDTEISILKNVRFKRYNSPQFDTDEASFRSKEPKNATAAPETERPLTNPSILQLCL